MKSLKEYLISENKETNVNEGMSNADISELTDLIKRFKDVKEEDLTDGDDLKPEICKALDRYDDYMEEVMSMVCVYHDKTTNADELAKEIAEMANDNEMRNGTEAHFVIEFLYELAGILNV